MKNIVFSGMAAMALLCGSLATDANAAPRHMNWAHAQHVSDAPRMNVRMHVRSNRGHHYGWNRGRHNPHRGMR